MSVALYPRVRWSTWTQVLGVLLFAVLTAISARITVVLPLTPVPLTLQVLTVVLSGLVLGARGGLFAQMLVLQAILLGAPLTAHGLSGVAAFVSPTAGYLVAFPLAAAAAGWVSDRSGVALWRCVLGGLAAVGVIYALGTAWLSVFVGLRSAWSLGAAPFVVADVMKVLVAAGVAAVTRKR